MRTETLVLKDMDDVVFENRNKEYGAYNIRKSYSKNVTTALCCNVFFIGLLFSSPYAISFFADEDVVLPKKDMPPLTLDPPPFIVPLEKPAVPVVRVRQASAALAPRVVTQEVPVTDDEPVAFTPGGADTGSEEGIDFPGTQTAGTADGLATIVEEPKVLDFAAVMPQYNGGQEAMMEFIMKKTRYPATARRLHIEGTVFVRFVVNTDGLVTNVEVIKGISADCDKEAARVIAMMPPWIAGAQNHMPVAVRMVLPIKFKLKE